jgi:tRNA (guanine10-N2)-methyltransferase
MDYLIRFTQTHESFRLPEIEALSTQLKAEYAKKDLHVEVEVLEYSLTSPFCIVRFHIRWRKSENDEQGDAVTHQHPKDRELLSTTAHNFISLSIQAKGIYEIWGLSDTGNYESLHASVHRRSRHLWAQYQRDTSFKFSIDAFLGKRGEREKKEIIDGFRYLGFEGKVEMKRPEEEWVVFEEWGAPLSSSVAGAGGVAVDVDIDGEVKEELYENGSSGQSKVATEDQNAGPVGNSTRLKGIFLGRKVGTSRRWLAEKHDLKKRPYISTTSMDAGLALITANLALAGPGKLFLDPFCGTGGFMVAAAELGAFVMGHDIDGRSFRGKEAGLEKGVGANFEKYGLGSLFGDCLTADLVHTPLHLKTRWLDGIICDPPYGVREGLKVLGSKKTESPPNGEAPSLSKQPHLIDGVPAHLLPGFVAPKKPYSFTRMLEDILDFGARTLVDGGRLAFWMPSANENEAGEEEVTVIPKHPVLEPKHECVQRFNKWSRRLLVYERTVGKVSGGTAAGLVEGAEELAVNGSRADDLNPFRRRYFQAFAEKPNG